MFVFVCCGVFVSLVIERSMHPSVCGFSCFFFSLVVNACGSAFLCAVSRASSSTCGIFIPRLALPVHLPPPSSQFSDRRRALMRIMYSFCASDYNTHIAAIHSLQETLDHQATFLHCLTILSHLEEELSPPLVDMYLFYCVIGITMASPMLRAASVSMVPLIASSHPETVFRMLGLVLPLLLSFPVVFFALSPVSLNNSKNLLALADRLRDLTKDDWWEVKAQLLRSCLSLLPLVSEKEASDGLLLFFLRFCCCCCCCWGV